MSKELIFTPRYELDTTRNLEGFIKFCRYDLTVFGADLDWEDCYWPKANLFFGNWDLPRGTPNSKYKLSQPILDFAKAYVRYVLGFKIKPKSRYEGTIFKCLEKALLEFCGSSDISNLTPSVLDRTAVLARERYTPTSAYHIGRLLKNLADFVCDKNLIPNSISWKNPNVRPVDTVRTGIKAQKIREKKLPTEAAINALAEIFASNPSEPDDIFTTSICALLLCVPSRISEVLSLHENCEVFETKRDGSKAYGLRFLPGKGAAPQIKWVPTAMVSLAQEAIKRIRSLTYEARNISKWFEQTPHKFYRNSNCIDLPDDLGLTITQRIQVLGYWNKPILRMKRPTLDEIQKIIMKQQPKGFPYFDSDRNIKFSEALFCFQRNQLSRKFNTSKVHVFRPVNCIVIARISKQKDPTKKNIFCRHGYKNEDGSLISLTTHNFRHLLNTMAQRGGLSQFEVAKWSGRTEMKQNRVYDHMTEFELVDMLRSKDSALSLQGPLEELKEQIAAKLPIERQAFNMLTIPTAHITESGYCIHDYTMSPCQKYLDCFNCTEQVCVKGDKRLKSIKEIYKKNKVLLTKMEQDIADGLSGADRWYEHTKMELHRAKNFLTLLNDPNIPNGSLIKLHNPNEFSPLKRAIENKALKKNEYDALLKNTTYNGEEY